MIIDLERPDFWSLIADDQVDESVQCVIAMDFNPMEIEEIVHGVGYRIAKPDTRTVAEVVNSLGNK